MKIFEALRNLHWVMKLFLWCLGVGCFLICIPGCKAAAPQTGNKPGLSFNVGYQVLGFDYPQSDQQKSLTVAVWYPTGAEPGLYDYGGPTNGRVSVDVAPLANNGPYPLLVFSHGYGGSGLGAVFLTEALAARGWIVACPDHHDKNTAVRIRIGQKKRFDRLSLLRHAREIAASGPENRVNYHYRLDEMSLALAGILNSKVFGQLIDRDRIAVGGHSFGGYTALGLCGTIPKYYEPRIKAVLLFSTGAGGYLYREKELGAVKIPSMLFLGEREAGQLRGEEKMADLAAKIFGNLPPPKYFLEIKGANHFSFNNRFSNRLGARLMSGSEEHFEVIRRYSIAFLEKYVAGRGDATGVLEQSDPFLTRFSFELVQVLEK